LLQLLGTSSPDSYRGFAPEPHWATTDSLGYNIMKTAGGATELVAVLNGMQ